MASDPVIAVCDACILYPFHLRNVIVQAAVDRLFHARWTDAIHDEWMQNLVANTPGLPADRLMATKRLMDLALPEARIAGYEQHIPAINLPDPDDRHVAAAAIAAGASTIITWNLRDFPVGALRKHNLVRQTPSWPISMNSFRSRPPARWRMPGAISDGRVCLRPTSSTSCEVKSSSGWRRRSKSISTISEPAVRLCRHPNFRFAGESLPPGRRLGRRPPLLRGDPATPPSEGEC